MFSNAYNYKFTFVGHNNMNVSLLLSATKVIYSMQYFSLLYELVNIGSDIVY